MINQRKKEEVIKKFKTFRSLYDKVFIIFSGSLWIISTLWDIYNLQRYWLDYTAELYACFFIFCMMVFSIHPTFLPVKIYNSFSLITTIKGRGTLLIIISLLFLNDNHKFHKFCAILLFLGGIIYFICEILVPTTREELEQIESFYKSKSSLNKVNVGNTENNSNISQNKASTEVKIENNNASGDIKSTEIMDKSAAILNNIQNEMDIKNNEIEEGTSNNNNMNEEEKKNAEEVKNNEEKEEKEEKEENKKENKDILIEEEIVRKTDNPYEIPEDF